MLQRRTLYLLAAVSLGHVLLISAQVQTRNGLPLIKAAAFDTFSTIQQGTSNVGDSITGIWSHYFALRGAARENDELRRRVLQLEGQVQELQAVATQTQALEETLAMRKSIAAPTVAARVIARDPTPGSFTVTIDRGSQDGVEAEMAVIAAQGVVGRVIGRPAPHTALVQLLVGHNAAAGAMFERSGAGGVVEGGGGNPPLRMELVPNTADVKPGDRVLTSGQDSLYPGGFLIGIVERAEKGSGIYRTIAVQPAVDFSHLNLVLVMLAKPGPPKPSGGR